MLKHFPLDNNVLLLYSEFKCSKSLVERLKSIYSSVYVLTDHFIVSDKYRIKREFENYQAFRLAKHAVSRMSFDRVFISQDRILETTLLSRLKQNKPFELIDIEEDCYYSIDPHLNGNGSLEYYRRMKDMYPLYVKIQKKCLSIFQRLLYGKDIYKDPNTVCYGMNKNIGSVYLLFPEQIRVEMQDKKLYRIDDEMLYKGIETIYGESSKTYRKGKQILFLFDLIERYNNKNDVFSLIQYLANICEKNEIELCYKYHPRETFKIKELDTNYATEIDSLIPAERILLDFNSNETLVIGNVTTALSIACAMGFQTISIAALQGNDSNELLKFYSNIGIVVPNDKSTLYETIETSLKLKGSNNGTV